MNLTTLEPQQTGLAAPVEEVRVRTYRMPTDLPESDGTYSWDSTTIVIAEISAGHKRGLGYTYTSASAAGLIREHLTQLLVGMDAMDPPSAWVAMNQRVRNLGNCGIAAMAISALDCALWDLKARLLGLPLSKLIGQVRNEVPIYGSGGFTSYDDRQLTRQLAGWAEAGIPRVKMKVGRDKSADVDRVRVARNAIGDKPDLFMDANGAYGVKESLTFAHTCWQEFRVSWFEEPRPSDDLAGLSHVRNFSPAGMDVAAGEYGFTLPYFKQMIDAGAVDCLQADITRCGGVTGFLAVANLCEASHIPLSAHCAPAQHVHPCCCIRPLRHLEFFHDHVRIERMLFDGFPEQQEGNLIPGMDQPGMGLEFKQQDAREFEV